MGGEITMIDHVNRMGILRPDRSDEHNKYHWDLPHHFRNASLWSDLQARCPLPQSAILTWVRTCTVYFF
jgi:hypothetical protein